MCVFWWEGSFPVALVIIPCQMLHKHMPRLLECDWSKLTLDSLEWLCLLEKQISLFLWVCETLMCSALFILFLIYPELEYIQSSKLSQYKWMLKSLSNIHLESVFLRTLIKLRIYYKLCCSLKNEMNKC